MSLWKPEQFRPAERENTPQPDTAIPEWLDSYPWLPILFLILLPFLVELPLLVFGLSTNPIWFDSGITSVTHGGLLPGLPYIDPNVGFTTQALGHLAVEDWLHGTIPWWNPYSGIGLPLAGEMQGNAFFLPFVFLLLLHNGVLWLKIAMQIFAGLATFALLRELKRGRLAALTGGALYALNGTFAWLPGPVSVVNTIPFLPLLLYGIERARKENGAPAILWIGLAIAGSLLAGFPEAAYISALLALAWALYRFFGERRRWRFAGRVIYGGLLGLLLAAPLLVAFFDYLLTTNTLTSHAFGDAYLPIQALSNLYLPYVYGPIFQTAGSNVLGAVWGNIGGYAGILLILFACMGVLAKGRERGLRWLLLGWILLAWAKSYGFTPVMEIMNHIPFLQEAAFYRYSPPSWEMALAILAAMAVDDLRWGIPRLRWPLAWTLGALALAVSIAWPWRASWGWSVAQAEKMAMLMGVAIIWALMGVSLVLLVWFVLRKERRRWALSTLLIVDAAVMFAVPELSGVHPGQVDRPAIHYLRTHLGLSRFYTLGPIQPNYGAYFQLASINHNYLPVAQNWVNYVQSSLFPFMNRTNGVVFLANFGTQYGVAALYQHIDNYEQVGVRYLITDSGQSLVPSATIPTGNYGNTPLPLLPGQSSEVALAAPSEWKGKELIDGVGVFQENYGNTANGNLAIQVCSTTHRCVAGSRPLSESRDNSVFLIPLAQSLPVEPSEALTITISHVGGNRPEALWLWPQAPGYAQSITGPQGPLSGKALQLSLEYGDAAADGIHKVYSDALLDIWELPHPAPYYTVMHGDCEISKPTRDGLVAQCSTPATLLRRELYMPGWTASVNGVSTAVSAYQKIFQKISLVAGKNVVRFRFAPPYVNYAWIAFGLSIIALLWLSYRAVFQLRANTQNKGEETSWRINRKNRRFRPGILWRLRS
jgi:heme exporter protein D